MAMKFGTTFSAPYAESLGLRPAEVYDSLIHELRLQLVRLSAYWDRTEPQPGQFDFQSLDRQVDEATKAKRSAAGAQRPATAGLSGGSRTTMAVSPW